MKRLIVSMFVVTLLASAAAFAESGSQKQGGRRGHRGPPPEAVAACQGSTEGASCSFTVPKRDITGTCLVLRRSNETACVPKDHVRKQPQ